MPLHILLCDEVLLYFNLWIEVVQRLNLIWIQIGLQIIKKFGNEKCLYIYIYKAMGRILLLPWNWPARPMPCLAQPHPTGHPRHLALFLWRPQYHCLPCPNTWPPHCLGPCPWGRCRAQLHHPSHAVPTLDTSLAVTNFRWKSKSNQMNLGGD
jgi:hypothetical protein